MRASCSPASACENHRPHPLRVEGLCVSYGRTPALGEVSFQTACGHCLALVGPNGAGKSTLLKALAGLVRRDHGTISWRGEELGHGCAEIAYLPQRSKIDWNFPATVRHVVEMGRYPHLGWWRRFGKRDAEAVDAALEAMQLTALQHRQINALSGGQQQRAFLARALAQQAHVFLLDEPLTGLDANATELLARLFRELAARGHLIISSHHDLDTVESIFDQVMIVNGGVVSFGATREAFRPEFIEAAYGMRRNLRPRSVHELAC